MPPLRRVVPCHGWRDGLTAARECYSEPAVTIRASAVIVMLSVNLSAAAPLICQMVCAPTPATSQPCHDADARLRVSADDHQCDHPADSVSLAVPTGKVGPGTRDMAIASPRGIEPRAAIAVFTRRTHGPPSPALRITPAVFSILRI